MQAVKSKSPGGERIWRRRAGSLIAVSTTWYKHWLITFIHGLEYGNDGSEYGTHGFAFGNDGSGYRNDALEYGNHGFEYGQGRSWRSLRAWRLCRRR